MAKTCRSKSTQAWITVQRRNAAREQLKAESIAALSKHAQRRIIHRMASQALQGALRTDEQGNMPSPYVKVGLNGLANVHHYLGNPDECRRMTTDTASFVLRTIDGLVGELHTLFRLATKAGGTL